MNILPISISQQKRYNPSFGVNDYVSKKILQAQAMEKANAIVERKTAEVVAAAAAAVTTSVQTLNSQLKSNGITYFNAKDNVINVASGYNGGYYTIRTAYHHPSEISAKDYIISAITNKHESAGGLYNYMNLVKDIKRQDIIQKGLKIHTYELNNNVKPDDRIMAAAKLSGVVGYTVLQNQLFFIDEEAYYYDNDEKTAYTINFTTQVGNVKPMVRTCKFITDNKGNTVGYKVKDWNTYQWGYAENEYIEQQEPSIKPERIANPENNKLYAEAFRFGNSTVKDYYRANAGVPIVLDYLSKKFKIKNIDENSLQIVRFYNKNKDIQTRICYYDPTIGQSFVFMPNGAYMYQMDYNKDSFGNIIACNKI